MRRYNRYRFCCNKLNSVKVDQNVTTISWQFKNCRDTSKLYKFQDISVIIFAAAVPQAASQILNSNSCQYCLYERVSNRINETPPGLHFVCIKQELASVNWQCWTRFQMLPTATAIVNGSFTRISLIVALALGQYCFPG